jgi:hypothetical protein
MRFSCSSASGRHRAIRRHPAAFSLAATLSLFLAAAAVSAPSLAGAATPWIQFPTSERLANPSTAIDQGQPTPGGCTYSIAVQLSPGQTEVGQQEVAENPATCQMQIQTGTPVSSAPSTTAQSPAGGASNGATAADSSDYDSGSDPSVTLDAGSDCCGKINTHSAGFFKSWFEDPIGIDVTKVHSTVDWHWNGDCVVNIATLGDSFNWYTASGWHLGGHNLYADVSCARALSSVKAHYYNNTFFAPGCAAPNYTSYDRNDAKGKGDGSLVGTINWNKSGECSGLLSFHDDISRTLN